MKIGNIDIKNNLILAPMAGISDVSFRELCKYFGAGLTVTEMVSVKGLYYNSKNTLKLLETSKSEVPCAVQLFGHEPKIFESVIKSGVLDKFDIIDINMGCPAPKIVKNKDGSYLLKDLKLAREIIETCVRATNKPITVKFRKGYYENDDILIEFAKMCESAGASCITVHPRTKEQGYSGKIDIFDIKKVKDEVSIPVIGNGDVVDKESFKNMLISNCDGVMIGRGAVGNPEIFSILQDKKVDMSKKNIAKLHISILKKYFEEDYIVKIFKRHAMKYVEAKIGAVEKRKKIALAKTLFEIEQILFSEN